MSIHHHHQARLRASWDDNAHAWTEAVRSGQIESRRSGTDAAILRACGDMRGARALDVGCGEGWLSRAMAAAGAEVLGVDASAELIDAARAAGPEKYLAADYDHLVATDALAAGPWDLIVCNFALLDDPVTPLLTALSARLAPGGRLLIQTVHPWVAAGEGAYVGAWRIEEFAGFGDGFRTPMPWYFRPLHEWTTSIAAAGLRLGMLEEPLHPATMRPLSLLLTCTREAP